MYSDKIYVYKFNVFWVVVSFDDFDVDENLIKLVIGINGKWFLFLMEVIVGDCVIVYFFNLLEIEFMFFYFYGLYLWNEIYMDGLVYVF